MPLILEDFPTVQNSETVNGKKLVIDLGRMFNQILWETWVRVKLQRWVVALRILV
ncbi:hypothetical protein V6Z11_A08G152900 [Gossypium hirsutum]